MSEAGTLIALLLLKVLGIQLSPDETITVMGVLFLLFAGFLWVKFGDEHNLEVRFEKKIKALNPSGPQKEAFNKYLLAFFALAMVFGTGYLRMRHTLPGVIITALSLVIFIATVQWIWPLYGLPAFGGNP